MDEQPPRADHDAIRTRFPWILQEGRAAVLSPDSDGLLCGLLMSHYLGWKVAGFYDGKVMVLASGVHVQDAVFLDIEMYRTSLKSVGQHMLLYDKDDLPNSWSQFNQCVSPNNLRGFDAKNDFRKKYPFATVHFLMGLVSAAHSLEVPKAAIAPLLFTDGSWMNLYRYTENALNWLEWLGAKDPDSPLNKLFLNRDFSMYEMLEEMDRFLRKRDTISVQGQRGDRLALSPRGRAQICAKMVAEATPGLVRLEDPAKRRVEEFLSLLAGLTGWKYDPKLWAWGGWRRAEFTKGMLGAKGEPRLGKRAYRELLERLPLSVAITAGDRMEYTLDLKGVIDPPSHRGRGAGRLG